LGDEETTYLEKRTSAAKQAAEKGMVLQKRKEERTPGPKGLNGPDIYGTAEAVPFVHPSVVARKNPKG
jgi:hypothetical protein